jgi:hypothetical protein
MKLITYENVDIASVVGYSLSIMYPTTNYLVLFFNGYSDTETNFHSIDRLFF